MEQLPYYTIVLKLIEIVMVVGLLHDPFWLQHVLALLGHHSLSNVLDYFVWLRITDEGSVPEMRIWSILLIESD